MTHKSRNSMPARNSAKGKRLARQGNTTQIPRYQTRRALRNAVANSGSAQRFRPNLAHYVGVATIVSGAAYLNNKDSILPELVYDTTVPEIHLNDRQFYAIQPHPAELFTQENPIYTVSESNDALLAGLAFGLVGLICSYKNIVSPNDVVLTLETPYKRAKAP